MENDNFSIGTTNGKNEIEIGDIIEIRNIQVYDLTLMGKADYYTTVEQFRQDFPRLHYEANAGEVKSVNVTGIKTVGFNAFDEKLEPGKI